MTAGGDSAQSIHCLMLFAMPRSAAGFSQLLSRLRPFEVERFLPFHAFPREREREREREGGGTRRYFTLTERARVDKRGVREKIVAPCTDNARVI